VGDDAWPSTPSETVGWEMGARTCLHIRPGRLTILECRFNKTTHHLKSKSRRFPERGNSHLQSKARYGQAVHWSLVGARHFDG